MAIVDVEAERRKDFIEKFEEKGFKIHHYFSKEEIIKSILPITVDFKKKEIGHVGNVTCAAAAVSCGAVKKEEEFWKEYQPNTIYCVHEDNDDGTQTIEFFNTRREDAINFYKQRLAICEGIYKTWQKEKGVNCCKWRKCGKVKELYVEMVEI